MEQEAKNLSANNGQNTEEMGAEKLSDKFETAFLGYNKELVLRFINELVQRQSSREKELTEKINSAAMHNEVLTAKVSAYEGRLRDLSAAREAENKKLAAMQEKELQQAELVEQLQTRVAELETVIERARDSAEMLKTRYDSLRKSADLAEQSAAEYKLKLQALEKDSEARVQALLAEAEVLRREEAERAEALQAQNSRQLQETSSRFADEIETLKREKNHLQVELEAALREHGAAMSANEQAAKRQDELARSLAAAQQELQRAAAGAQEANGHLARLSADRENIIKVLRDRDMELQSKNTALANLSSLLRAKDQRIAQDGAVLAQREQMLRDKDAEIVRHCSKLQAYEKQNADLTARLQQVMDSQRKAQQNLYSAQRGTENCYPQNFQQERTAAVRPAQPGCPPYGARPQGYAPHYCAAPQAPYMPAGVCPQQENERPVAWPNPAEQMKR